MTKIKLTKQEEKIEEDLLKGAYAPVSPTVLNSIVEAIELRKKNSVINIRMNSGDIKRLKVKAKKLGIPYQTFISEILHRFAA